jgi:hypothetical protein
MQFVGINDRLGSMDKQFVGINDRLGSMDKQFVGINDRLDRLELGQNELRAGGVVQIGKLQEIDRNMRVLHEAAMSAIAALPEATYATKTEVAELRERVERRLDPLEAAVHHHTTEIAKLKGDPFTGDGH